MFWTSLCPSSGALDRILLYMVFSTWCAGWCLEKLGPRTCALCTLYGLALPKMGIMMPETCWT